MSGHLSNLMIRIVWSLKNFNQGFWRTIKNLLSQKIIVFQSKNNSNLNTEDLIKLGLQKEFESKKIKLKKDLG